MIRRAEAIREVLTFGALPVVGFVLYTDLLALADYGRGLERFVGIVFGAGLIFALPALRMNRQRAVYVFLICLAIGYFLFRSVQAAEVIRETDGPWVDVGTTTIQAGELVRRGENPYTTFIDPNGIQNNPEGSGFTYAGGFKYGPVMIWAYMPFVAFVGPDGYYVLNWLAVIATGVGAYFFLERRAGSLAGAGGFVLALAPGILARELFDAGFNDIVPAALTMWALAARERGAPIVAGLALGLSIATKSVPGVIVALPIVLMFDKDRMRVAVTTLVVAVAGHLPWLVTSTPELIAGLVTFNLTRPVDDTSLLHWIPTWLRTPLGAIALGTALVLSARFASRARAHGIGTFAALISATLAVSFAASPAVHGNYLIWFFPFIGLALAARIWDQGPREAQPQPSS